MIFITTVVLEPSQKPAFAIDTCEQLTAALDLDGQTAERLRYQNFYFQNWHRDELLGLNAEVFQAACISTSDVAAAA